MPKITWSETDDEIIKRYFDKIPIGLIPSKLNCGWLNARLVEQRCREIGLLPRRNKYVVVARKLLKPAAYGIWFLAIIYILFLVGARHGFMGFLCAAGIVWGCALLIGAGD